MKEWNIYKLKQHVYIHIYIYILYIYMYVCIIMCVYIFIYILGKNMNIMLSNPLIQNGSDIDYY